MEEFMLMDNLFYKEDKKGFIKEFGELLRKWKIEDVLELEYTKTEDGNEFVTINFVGDGKTTVNVHMDSYAAMIKDVMKALY